MQNQTDQASQTAKGAELEALKAFQSDLSGCWELFKDDRALQHAARYKSARSLYLAGQTAEARKRFQKLYADALKQDVLPAIGLEFRLALQGSGAEDPWSNLMTKTAAAWRQEKHRPAILALARQCWRLDDEPLAQHLLAMALEGLTEPKERTPLLLAEIDLLIEMGQVPMADGMLQKLLSEPAAAQRPDLWRLASSLAEKRDAPARAIECLEKALELEFRKLPEVIDLETVRNEYGKVLAHYQGLVDAMIALKLPPPDGFLTKVIKTADRWRSLDHNGDQVCAATAPILQRLGLRELSWDYLTTPIALQPGEASAWTNLGAALGRRGDLKLADRAYQAAFEAEPTNAQILWDRAQNLRQAGDVQGAQKLLRQLVEGA